MATGKDQTSLEKGLAILQELATSEAPQTISDLARATSLNRTTAYRLCEVLERSGWLQSAADGQAGKRRRMDLGPQMLGLAVLATSKYGPEARLQPLIEALAQRIGETVHAAVLDGTSIIHVAFAVPGPGPHLAVRPGARELAHVTGLGKAMLATLPRDEILHRYPEEELPTHTPKGVSSRSALLDELGAIAARGYAIDDEESRAGVRCVGAPIFGPNGTATFAVSVTTMPVRLAGERLDAVAREVCSTAALASAAFGGAIPRGWGSGRRDETEPGDR